MATDDSKRKPRSRLPVPTPAPASEGTAPLKPVTPKIGEGPGNLKGRSDAFRSRRGRTK